MGEIIYTTPSTHGYDVEEGLNQQDISLLYASRENIDFAAQAGIVPDALKNPIQTFLEASNQASSIENAPATLGADIHEASNGYLNSMFDMMANRNPVTVFNFHAAHGGFVKEIRRIATEPMLKIAHGAARLLGLRQMADNIAVSEGLADVMDEATSVQSMEGVPDHITQVLGTYLNEPLKAYEAVREMRTTMSAEERMQDITALKTALNANEPWAQMYSQILRETAEEDVNVTIAQGAPKTMELTDPPRDENAFYPYG